MRISPRASSRNRRGEIWISSLILFSIAGLIAADSDSKSETTAPPTKEVSGLLRGRVLDEHDKPLADARVRIAVPASDMRFVDHTTQHKLYEATTGPNGEYRLKITDLAGPTTVSIDVMLPGYQRLSGTLMRGGDDRRVEVVPNAIREASVNLKPSAYVAGIVVDEQGQPIPDVEVGGNANTAMASGGVERTHANSEGKFELFNYAPEGFAFQGVQTKGVISFSHPHFLDHQIDDIYAINEDQQHNLRIVLKSGHKISGTGLTDTGTPAANALVIAQKSDGGFRKAIMTDLDGKFSLFGLASGQTKLTVRAFDQDQKHKSQIDLTTNQRDLKLRLQSVALPKGTKRYSVLGMQLINVTPEVVDAYDLFNESGAMILDPGPDSDRLKIGTIEKGYCLWCVGDTNVASVKEFVEHLLAHTGDQTADKYSIRVVYSLRNLEFDGTNTQYLELPAAEIPKLKAVLEEINSE